MSLGRQTIKVTTTGSAGAAVGNSDSKVINGWIEDISIDYNASAPGTTDLIISYEDGSGDILVINNAAADVHKHPRAKPVDNANAAITNAFTRFVINGLINIDLKQCDALTDAVVVKIRYSKP